MGWLLVDHQESLRGASGLVHFNRDMMKVICARTGDDLWYTIWSFGFCFIG